MCNRFSKTELFPRHIDHVLYQWKKEAFSKSILHPWKQLGKAFVEIPHRDWENSWYPSNTPHYMEKSTPHVRKSWVDNVIVIIILLCFFCVICQRESNEPNQCNNLYTYLNLSFSSISSGGSKVINLTISSIFSVLIRLEKNVKSN